MLLPLTRLIVPYNTTKALTGVSDKSLIAVSKSVVLPKPGILINIFGAGDGNRTHAASLEG